jgi:hypothetical protein
MKSAASSGYLLLYGVTIITRIYLP